MRKAPDYLLIFIMGLLLLIGVIMVYSASSVRAAEDFGDGFFFLKRQLMWVVIGAAAIWVTMRIPTSFWYRYANLIFVSTLVLLVIVLIPGVGKTVNGAQRWIGVGAFQLQPSEFMKLAMVIWLARYLTEVREGIRKLRGLVWPLGALGLVFGLIMLEPDMGTALAITGTVFLILFVAGMRWGHLIAMGSVGVAGVLGLALSAEYRMKRLLTFLNPEADPLGDGYQPLQSRLALGSGGLFGVGLGRSRQKLYYLPENHTDYIFAILGEELGLLGTLTVLILFGLFAWRGFRIAAVATDRFSSLLALGLTTMVVLQAIMNIAVVTNSIPPTGVPLPFLSYGGSSLLPTMAGVGILLGVSRSATR
jgi:cell division protein FtsW